MDDVTINDLRRLGEELAGALQSPWEPACIARAFSTPAEGELALTMQRWIDLDISDLKGFHNFGTDIRRP